MINNQINLRFDNLDYSIIKKKNINPAFFLFLNGFIYLSVAIPFVVLWLLEVPFEINEELHQASDIEYIRFMSIFLGIFLSISLVCIIVGVLFLRRKPQDYIFISKDLNFDEIYKIRQNKRTTIYIKKNKGLIYDEVTEGVLEINTLSEINDILNKYLFWLKWENIEDFKIKMKNKKTVLEFMEKTNKTVLKYRYSIPQSNSYLPERITETITNRTRSGKSNLSSYNIYYFTDNNVQRNLNLPNKVTDYFNDAL
ncbi:MAG: hypothetical protein CVV60_05970 [Tenericutes bacterium HGW-Tenericutes-5]|nr:MAG: hypothetical protein CVV60_05970 [Tenericutes bacterium HGW-Tenericutes-5]